MSAGSTSIDRSDGAVAAGHEVVARVGAEILERGGNAVDSVVAMVAAGCVCEPTLTSLGGGGFIIVGDGTDADPTLIDFFTRQPGLDARPRLSPWEIHELELDGTVLRYGTGPASVAVPGVPRGLAHTSRRFGRLPLREVLQPAIALAADGVALTRTQAGEHLANAPLIARDPEGEQLWFLDGRVRAEGERFHQPQLATALEELAATEGEAMYTGAIADALMRWSDDRGARISRTDLERYEVVERAPLQLRVGDICIYGNPEPSMGGSICVRLLQTMLEEEGAARDLAATRDHAVGRAIVRVLRQLDPPRTRCPEVGEAVVGAAEFSRSPNTTHVSAIDADGMLAGATTTVGYGAGEFIPGTGIQLNNMLAEYDHTLERLPGTTVPSMMTPTILTSPRTMVQLGSAGSDRIPTAIAQIVERMWSGMNLEEAILAPRFAWDGRVLHAEPGFHAAALEQLAQQHTIIAWPAPDSYFGTANGTAMRGAQPHAFGDPRREATGIVV